MSTYLGSAVTIIWNRGLVIFRMVDMHISRIYGLEWFRLMFL